MCVVDAASAVFEEVSVSFHTSLPQSTQLLSGYRDDLTVEVIFFGNSDKSGDVVVNKEASALANDVKAKL